MAQRTWKNYALTGSAEGASEITNDAFEDRVEAEWHACTVDRKALKQLIKRDDRTALTHFALWLGLLAVSGIAAYLTWGTLWCVPAFAIYGVLYSAADHRHHELSHGTPFKTRWVNDVLFQLCAFMTLREGFYYRWSHSRHHTHTLIVGRDPEIAAKTSAEPRRHRFRSVLHQGRMDAVFPYLQERQRRSYRRRQALRS